MKQPEGTKVARVLRRRATWLAAIACAVLATWFARDVLGRESNPASQAGRWVAVQKNTHENRSAFTGVLMPARSVDINPAADGVLQDVAVAWGDRVRKDQPLFTVRSADLDQQLRDAQVAQIKGQGEFEAQMDPENAPDGQALLRRHTAATAALAKARSRLAETQTLFDKGYVARSEFDEAAQQVTQAAQELDATERELAAARRKWNGPARAVAGLEQRGRIEKLARLQATQAGMSVRSPIDGVVLYPVAAEGREGPARRELRTAAPVTAREAVMTIGDTSSYLVRGTVGEPETRWVAPGLQVQVQLAGASGGSLTGRVLRVAAQAQPVRGGGMAAPEFEIQVQVPAPGERADPHALESLRIGGSVRVQLASPGNSQLWELPLAALAWDASGQPYVEARREGSASARRRVSVVGVGESHALVSQGLQAGDEVWVAPGAAGTPEASPPGNSLRGWVRRLLDEE